MSEPFTFKTSKRLKAGFAGFRLATAAFRSFYFEALIFWFLIRQKEQEKVILVLAIIYVERDSDI